MSGEELERLALGAATGAAPELDTIAEEAAERHGMDTLVMTKEDLIKVAAFMAEVQRKSFVLGMRLGAKLVVDAGRPT